MRNVYAETKILLTPSVWQEGFGRVVSEAQISGIPVLSSDRGGLPNSVGPGGIVLSCNAPLSDWCACLRSLWSDAAAYERLSALASAHSRREEMRPDGIADSFVQLAISALRKI